LRPASGPAGLGAGPASGPAATQAPASSLPGIVIAPEALRQGDPLLAWILSSEADAVPYDARLEDAGGKAAAKAQSFDATALLPSLKLKEGARAPRLSGVLIPIPMDLKPGQYRLVLRGPRSVAGAEASELVRQVTVAARAFPFEEIPLNGANSELLQVPDPKKDAEAKLLYALLSGVDTEATFLGASSFSMPVEAKRRTAGFGDRRRYLYQSGGSDSSVHQGIDFAVAHGMPVLAAARGKVVFAAERIVTGNTVVIEHLPGLFSIYMHLSGIEAKPGDVLEKGQKIGVSGSTGLSTGPHLHWELRAKGVAVDPEYWLARPPLDNELLIAKMTGLIEGR
jgi:murein DD-endopeptidase MepM/ murein hydrolase activator NlpD